jgi:hypothetical protein
MIDTVSSDDFVRLPEGYVLRGRDYECSFVGLIRLETQPQLRKAIGTEVGSWDISFYCLRSDYPKPKRVLHEMALSDKTGMSFCWVWPEQVARHEEYGWFSTGETREVTHE